MDFGHQERKPSSLRNLLLVRSGLLGGEAILSLDKGRSVNSQCSAVQPVRCLGFWREIMMFEQT
jgi:hypothetical protein